MPINNYNTGRDVSVSIVLPSGPTTFANITDFTSRERTKQVESHGIDGVSRFQEIPNGWEGSITIDRANANADAAIAALENLYYTGANVPGSTITETIAEAPGGVTQWRYTGVMFKLTDHGNFRGDNKVTQKLDWVASNRIQVQ